MTSTIVPNGSEIASDLLSASDKSASTTVTVQNTGDLLAILEQNPPRSFATLKTTCGLLGTYLNLPGNQVPFDMIEARRGGFRQFLVGRGLRGYKENSVRTFVNQLNVLLKTARKFGWNPRESCLRGMEGACWRLRPKGRSGTSYGISLSSRELLAR